MYIIYTKNEMKNLINYINGQIRIKSSFFKKGCDYMDINFIPPDYDCKPLDPYFSGLIDTDGSIVFNFPGNRIECHLELEYNDYTKKYNLDNVIPNYKPFILLRTKTIKNRSNKYSSIAFKYQTVGGMIHLYETFMENRLYSDL